MSALEANHKVHSSQWSLKMLSQNGEVFLESG